MFCGHCGSKLDSGAKFCQDCGKGVPIRNESNGSYNEEKSSIVLSKKSDSVSTPITDSQVNHPDRNDGLLRTFVGEKKEDYYLNKWSKGEQTWNWAAFFLGIFWLGYRKLYVPIFVMLAIFLVIDVVFALVGINDTYESNAIGIGVGLTLGFLGNYLYRQQANKKISRLQVQYRDYDQLRHNVKLSGGGSWAGAFAAIGLFVGYLAVSMFIITYVPAVTGSSETEFVNVSRTTSSLEDPQEITQADIEDEIIEIIQHNIKALENEDQDEYMSMLVEGSDQYEQTQDMIINIFENYDLAYDISDIEFISVTEEEVKVRVTQTTTKLEGADFRDNESILIHTLNHHGGDWKFYEGEIESVSYFDEEYVSEEDTATYYEEAEYIAQESCISCHGGDLEGGIGPSLKDVGYRLSPSEIEDIIIYGMGNMPGGLVSDDEAYLLAEWLYSLE